MTRDDVQAWLDAYDPAAIAALFTEDATYAYHPWDEGEELLRGRDAIIANWLEEQDQPGSTSDAEGVAPCPPDGEN